MIGIIGGSGLYEMPGFKEKERRKVQTPFGEPSDEYIIGHIGERDVVFLSRHSQRHNIPPHRVNYRANIWGLRKLGVERVIAVNAVGGINSSYVPGDLVLPDQIIDFTKCRAATFYEGGDVFHLDFTEPYCPELRMMFQDVSAGAGLKLINSGTYVCTEGPRLETAAEIRLFRMIGADLVGMTGMPESILSRELELCYAAVMVVTNLAAGLSGKKLTTTEVLETMRLSMERVKTLISRVIAEIQPKRGCPCKDALKGAGM